MLYDRTLIQIRERSFLDLLDLALYVVRSRPILLGLTAFVGIAPWAAINYWLLSEPEFPRPAWVALLVLQAPWATAPLTLVLGDLMFGVPARLSRMAKTMLVSIPAMIVSQLLLRGFLLVTVIGYPFMPAQYAFMNEVILLERVGLFPKPRAQQKEPSCFGRSRTLTRGMEGDLFVRWLVQVFLGLAFALSFWMCATTLGATLIGSELTWHQPGISDLDGPIFQTAVWIAVAFFAVYRYFSYIDRRIRLEGWELAMRLTVVASRLEERPN
jgi:hypothetical protein